MVVLLAASFGGGWPWPVLAVVVFMGMAVCAQLSSVLVVLGKGGVVVGGQCQVVGV